MTAHHHTNQSKSSGKVTTSKPLPNKADNNKANQSKSITPSQPIKVQTTAPWLGEIPAHWDCIRMKHLFKDVSIKGKPNAELLSVTQDQGVVPRTWVENRMVMPSGALGSFKFINKGDFAISLRSFEGGLEYCHHDGIISPAYTVLKAQRNFDSQFYKYLFKSTSFISELQTSVVGIRQGKNISYFELSYSFLPIPPLAEQTAIAQFLDHKTALIDKAIGIKEQQIALLQERRQILIHRAVTRGLNPKVKLKPSGVEWIGDIPEGWEVTQIKKITQTTSGGTPQSGNTSYYNGHIPWVRTTDLNNDELFDVPEKITEKALRDTACKMVPENTVCIAMYGGPGTIGKHAILRFSGTLNQALCGIFPSEKLYHEYLYYYAKFYRPHWMIVAKGTRVDPNISQDEVRKMLIPLPSVTEQYSIVEFIQTVSQKTSTAISLKQQEIEKLKEYKATLINSAVTGKINIASPCPAKPTNRL